MAGSAIRASHLTNDDRVQDPYCLRCQPQVMGAALDILRQAATTLACEANGVTDNPLIFTDPDEALSGGNFHAEPVAFAADIIALAVCEIGSLSERRIAMLVDPALSGLPAFLTPKPGLNSGFMIPQVTAAALVSENKQRAYPASVDSIPTSANQEDHVSMAAHGARRLLPMIENANAVIGDRVAGRGARLRLPRAARVERTAGGSAPPGALGGSPSRRRSPFPSRHGKGDPARALRRGDRRRRGRGLARSRGGCGVNGRFSDNRIFGHPIIFRDRLFSRPCKEENFRFGFPIGGVRCRWEPMYRLVQAGGAGVAQGMQ